MASGWSIAAKAEVSEVETDRQLLCRNCGAPAHHPHHIVPLSTSTPGRLEVRRNLMPLCSRCHRGHHDGNVEIPQNVLTTDELSFAVQEMGPGWVDHRYPLKRIIDIEAEVPW